ncbi:MAG: 50S ribosomal protein L28 [Candidatus Margulisiibacteriota bacterium]
MSKKCVICDKKAVIGNSVSHSNMKSKRKFRPNLQKINIILKGKACKEYVCTKCLKADKIRKVA